VRKEAATRPPEDEQGEAVYRAPAGQVKPPGTGDRRPGRGSFAHAGQATHPQALLRSSWSMAG
jgi:hypothetical protein